MPHSSKMWALNMPHSSKMWAMPHSNKMQGIGICPILVKWRADRNVYSTVIPVPGHDVIGLSMFTLGSFTAVTRSGQRAVVIVVADIATVVVDVSIRPRKYTMRYELELSLMKYILTDSPFQ